MCSAPAANGWNDALTHLNRADLAAIKRTALSTGSLSFIAMHSDNVGAAG
jgi:hypothetical protein